MSQGTISDYAVYEAGAVPPSPISLEEFEQLKETVLFTNEDVQYLRMSWDVLHDQVDAVVDTWFKFITAHPFLAQTFSRTSDGQLDQRYLAATRQRFIQWVQDTAQAKYDQQWLNYQYEIGRRHHRTAKNKTDHVDSVEIVPLRFIPLLLVPVVGALKPFLGKKGHSTDQVAKMSQAWLKSVLLQVTLWSQPYIKEGDF